MSLEHKALHIAILAPDDARSAIVTAGLAAAGFQKLEAIADGPDLSLRLLQLEPDVLVVDIASPNEADFQRYCTACRALARPTVMMVERTDRDMMDAAIAAGVGAYSVDGLQPKKLPTLVALAVSRFKADHQLRTELDQARSALADRKLVDRAKGLVMLRRGLSEPEAYALMRSTAMKSNQKLVEVAQSVLSADALLIEG
jgi:two-component system, response regulator / RNA-binding antiterminator